MDNHTVSLDDITYNRLVSYRASLEIAVRTNPTAYPKWLREGRLSLDDAVAWLLDTKEKHHARAKEARKRKTTKHEPGCNQPCCDLQPHDRIATADGDLRPPA